jgi:hypothetical protein
MSNLERKAKAAEEMFARMVGLMSESMAVGAGGLRTGGVEVPKWLRN